MSLLEALKDSNQSLIPCCLFCSSKNRNLTTQTAWNSPLTLGKDSLFLCWLSFAPSLLNGCFHISLLDSFIFSPRKRTHCKDSAQIYSGNAVSVCSMLLYQFQDRRKSTVCGWRCSGRNHAFEKRIASFSSSSCSLLLMAQEAFTPFKSSAFEVIKQRAVYRQEILKYLIAFFSVAQGSQPQAFSNTWKKGHLSMLEWTWNRGLLNWTHLWPNCL